MAEVLPVVLAAKELARQEEIELLEEECDFRRRFTARESGIEVLNAA